MNEIKDILLKFKNGEISLDRATKLLNLFSIEHIENEVTLDSGRFLRKGIPEIIYVEKKNPEIVVKIIEKQLEMNKVILLSRVLTNHLETIKKHFSGDFRLIISSTYEPYTVVITHKDYQFSHSKFKIGILTAGTSDLPIAEEVKAISNIMGIDCLQFNDVGIAGVHRLFTPLKTMIESDVKVLVVIAGMEGALPAIVSSLVNIPVIGVPTSVGYGYGGKGEAALMTMLQTCSPGLVVVNIDNGINAGATAALIVRLIEDNT
ncbi:MAG: nickel pincer cofactor biosynthesis protein LarB [Candidatus Hodarchaeales archaeon]